MKSFCPAIPICVVLLWGGFAARAQQPEQKPSEPAKEKPAESPAASPESKPEPRPKAAAPVGFGHDAMVDRRLAALERLRSLTFDQIKLDSEKRKTIDRYFDEYMAGLLNPKQKAHSVPEQSNITPPQELPELRRKQIAAQKEGDQAAVNALQAKISAAMISEEPCILDSPVYFVLKVAAELADEQKKEFEKIAERWRALQVNEIAPDNPYKQLMRATRDPALGRTEEQREATFKITADGMRAVPFPQRNDKAIMAEQADKTKPLIIEKLDPGQRDHLEKTIVMLAKWEKENEEIVPKLRARLRDFERTSQTRAGEPKTVAP